MVREAYAHYLTENPPQSASMSESIYLLNDAGQLHELNESPYLTEARLQELLADHPDLLAGKQLDASAPRRFLFITREIGVPDREDAANRWSLDHLFIDQDGIPTLVEVKRATDTRIRREVIGQILDYAANASAYWTIDGIRANFKQSCEERGEEAETTLAEFLATPSSVTVGAAAGARVEDQEANFWETVNINLRAGKIRMLIVADVIPPELQRIIEFLNEQMDPADILGVAIKQYKAKGLRTLVPRVVGLTSAGESKKSRRSGGAQAQRWSVDDFLAHLDRKHPHAIAPARRIIEHFTRPGFTFVGGRGKKPTLIASTNDPVQVYPFALGAQNFVEIYFQWYLTRPPFDQLAYRQELMDRLNAIPGVDLAPDRIAARPRFAVDLLAEEAHLNIFLDSFDWFVACLREANE